MSEQPQVTFISGQRGGRLVHDQEPRILRQRAQDFDALTIADAGACRPPGSGSQIEFNFEGREQRLGLGRALQSSRPPRPRGA